MRKFALAAATALSLLPITAQAQSPVVVELFTSQGCSSCPPADRVLEQLAGRDYVIALALHVDYWDYLGWKDEFANPAFSARQRRYARTWNERSVYTPQMVVQGEGYMVGSRGEAVQRHIMEYERAPETVVLAAVADRGAVEVTVQPVGRGVAESMIYLVGYSNGQDVSIESGELRGQTLHYINIVESWETIAHWDGSSAFNVRAGNLRDLQYVVIVQENGQGKILAAARIE